jgi:hypothetical protein
VLDRAIALRPRLIVFGLYFGNDLYDVFKLAAGRPELEALVRPSLRDSAAALETEAPIGSRVAYLFELGDTATHQTGGGWPIRRFLSRNSRLYALARAGVDAATGRSSRVPATLARDLDRALLGMTEEQKRFITVYRGAEWTTLLTPEYRDLVLDDRDPRIRIGVEASKGLLVRTDSTVRANGIRFLVVLLPTKESVFAAKMEPGDRSGSMERLVGNEERIHDELIDWFEANGIDWVDALPVLRSAPEQPYFPDADGHPNELGHRLIADAVSRRIDGSH